MMFVLWVIHVASSKKHKKRTWEAIDQTWRLMASSTNKMAMSRRFPTDQAIEIQLAAVSFGSPCYQPPAIHRFPQWSSSHEGAKHYHHHD